MADLIVNHVSRQSPQFADFQKHGDASAYAGMFLTYDRVFPDGAREADLLKIYRPRPALPFTRLRLENGTERLLWTTFTPEQIDIDVRDPEGQALSSSRSWINFRQPAFARSAWTPPATPSRSRGPRAS